MAGLCMELESVLIRVLKKKVVLDNVPAYFNIERARYISLLVVHEREN